MRNLSLALVLLLAATSAAEASRIGEPMGEVALSASRDEIVSEITSASFQLITFYVVADLDYAEIGRPDWNATNGLIGWEAGHVIPPEFIITSYEYRNFPAEPWLIGFEQWYASVGRTLLADEGPHYLKVYSGILVQEPAPQNLRLSLRPHEPSSFDPASPGFADGIAVGECEYEDSTPARCLRAFARTSDLWINRVVPVETDTWSTLKSRWQE